MKKEFFKDFIFLRKTGMIVLFTIMLFSFSSCATIVNTLLGTSTCINPGCDRDALGYATYCIYHSDREPVEVNTKNIYKVDKPLSEEEMKAKMKKNTFSMYFSSPLITNKCKA